MLVQLGFCFLCLADFKKKKQKERKKDREIAAGVCLRVIVHNPCNALPDQQQFSHKHFVSFAHLTGF